MHQDSDNNQTTPSNSSKCENDIKMVYAQEMHNLAKRLFPIPRSITGNGTRQTLHILKELIPNLTLTEIPSGTKVLDWVIPKEWNLNEAYIIDPQGHKICNTNVNNLHILNYSTPIDIELELDELKEHLYTQESLPDAIPYFTSYYKERWGFCIAFQDFEKLTPGTYTVHVDATLEPGSLTYGELFIPGKRKDEILISTYVCHPSMANNELSGPIVSTYLAKWISELKDPEFSYRILFIPETIGSIAYISKNLQKLRERVLTGFVITCVGDERNYSYLPSRDGDGLCDKVIPHVLQHIYPDYDSYSYLERGSDERQYCSPGVDLKVASLMRSKYAEYPEYHTSKDDLNLVTAQGLGDSLQAYIHCISIIENNHIYIANQPCEPQMGKRGLYPTIGNSILPQDTDRMMHILAYCDGRKDLLDIADILNAPAWELIPLFRTLADHELISEVNNVS